MSVWLVKSKENCKEYRNRRYSEQLLPPWCWGRASEKELPLYPQGHRNKIETSVERACGSLSGREVAVASAELAENLPSRTFQKSPSKLPRKAVHGLVSHGRCSLTKLLRVPGEAVGCCRPPWRCRAGRWGRRVRRRSSAQAWKCGEIHQHDDRPRMRKAWSRTARGLVWIGESL